MESSRYVVEHMRFLVSHRDSYYLRRIVYKLEKSRNGFCPGSGKDF